jgi:hypothetical protein
MTRNVIHAPASRWRSTGSEVPPFGAGEVDGR